MDNDQVWILKEQIAIMKEMNEMQWKLVKLQERQSEVLDRVIMLGT